MTDARVYTGYGEVLLQPGSADFQARTFTAYAEVLTPTYQIRLPKAYALAVVGPKPDSVALTKSYALAVLHDTAVGPLPDTGTTTRRRPVVAFLG